MYTLVPGTIIAWPHCPSHFVILNEVKDLMTLGFFSPYRGFRMTKVNYRGFRMTKVNYQGFRMTNVKRRAAHTLSAV